MSEPVRPVPLLRTSELVRRLRDHTSRSRQRPEDREGFEGALLPEAHERSVCRFDAAVCGEVIQHISARCQHIRNPLKVALGWRERLPHMHCVAGVGGSA